MKSTNKTIFKPVERLLKDYAAKYPDHRLDIVVRKNYDNDVYSTKFIIFVNDGSMLCNEYKEDKTVFAAMKELMELFWTQTGVCPFVYHDGDYVGESW